MTVTLPTDLEEFVAQGIAKGRFKSNDDAVQRAVRLLRDDDEERRVKYERLKADIAVGIDEIERGDVVPMEDVDTFLARMHAEFDRRKSVPCSK